MRVRTLRKHSNAYPPQLVKNVGRKYDLSDQDAQNLIAAGLVEEDKPVQAEGDAT